MITTGMHLSVETGVSVFYLLVVAVCFMPNIPGGDGRRHFVRLMKNVFMPVGSVAFVEVLLADALTSVSKIFKDVGVTLVAIYAQFSNTNIIEYHDHGMILVALLFSLPYWIRVRQCWVQFQGASDNLSRIPITLNILKYMSAFPPIWLTAAASLGYSRPHLSDLITFLAVINSGYSFAVSVAETMDLLYINLCVLF